MSNGAGTGVQTVHPGEIAIPRVERPSAFVLCPDLLGDVAFLHNDSEDVGMVFSSHLR